MDFNYTFRQAHTDRLEDAGIKRYRQEPQDGYIVEHSTEETPRRHNIPQRVKRVALAIAQLLVK